MNMREITLRRIARRENYTPYIYYIYIGSPVEYIGTYVYSCNWQVRAYQMVLKKEVGKMRFEYI